MLKEKQPGKKRRLYHFYNLINDFNFYDYKKIHYKGFKGILYKIERYSDYKKIDSMDQFINKLNSIINKYDNTLILTTYKEYAPEIKERCLFLAL